MKCVYCREPAGLFKKICRDCSRLSDIIRSLPSSFGFRELMDRLMETGVANEKIERFLETDVNGQGSLNDQITARMTNEIMGSLGQPSYMTSQDVKKVRQEIASGNPPSKQAPHEHEEKS